MEKTSDYCFTLPWPPSVNNYRTVWNNRLITSKRGREYTDTVILLMRNLKLENEQIEQPVLISLIMKPPTKRKFDCSNFLKAYEDALVKSGFLVDDHWIEYGSIRKGPKIEGGELFVNLDLIQAHH